MRKLAAVDKGSSAKDCVLLLQGLIHMHGVLQLTMLSRCHHSYLNPNFLGRSYYWPAKLGGSY